jgi:hypothetical protein
MLKSLKGEFSKNYRIFHDLALDSVQEKASKWVKSLNFNKENMEPVYCNS